MSSVISGSALTSPAIGRFGQNAVESILSAALTTVCGVVGGVILARVLGPEVRGIFATATIWPIVLSQLGDMGLGYALAYSIGRGPHRASELWTLALLASVVLGLVLAGSAALVLPYLLQRGFSHSLLGIALSAIPFMLATNYQLYILLGAGCIREHNWLRLGISLLYMGGVALLAVANDTSVGAYCVLFTANQCIAFVISGLVVARRLRVFITWPTQVRAELVFGLKTQLGALASHTSLRLDQLLMTALLPSAELGQYVVAVAVAGITAPLFSGLAWLTLPRLAQSPSPLAGGIEAARCLRLAFMMALPAVILGVIVIPVAIPVVFGLGYQPATRAAQVLLVASLFQGANVVLGTALRGLGHPGKSALSEGAGAVATILLLAVLLPRFGIIGAAVASLAAYGLVSILQNRDLLVATGVNAGAAFLNLTRRRERCQ